MYALFTLLAGACQSAMASLNGMLTNHVGMFGMSFMVHAIGGILLILYMKATTGEKLKISGMPWYLYSAGFFGIFLVVSSSYCIGILGVSFMTCISVTGLLLRGRGVFPLLVRRKQGCDDRLHPFRHGLVLSRTAIQGIQYQPVIGISGIQRRHTTIPQH